MRSHPLEDQWSRLSEFIAATMGLHFSDERRDDLQRGFAGAAMELGFKDYAACLEWLLLKTPTEARIQVLAKHLTVGETYFFRDEQVLSAIAENILPELIRARRGGEQRLRIWSAACCTGEEAYMLAVLLKRALPDMRDWQVTITGTDINTHFLQKAEAGIYRDWSFRNAPEWLKQHFNRNADGDYVILPEIRQMVNFRYLNLADDAYPSLETDTHAMDLILCRNVLMYFTPALAGSVIGKLRHALVDDGWLAVSPIEVTKTLFSTFESVNFPGAVLFQKSGSPSQTKPMTGASSSLPESDAGGIEESAPVEWAANSIDNDSEKSGEPDAPLDAPLDAPVCAEALFRQGRKPAGRDYASESAAMARTLADQGKLDDAQAWCENWIDAGKLDPAGHYLRAVILLERGDLPQALASLQRTIYLDPKFVLAYFSMGNAALVRGKPDEADKHFSIALDLLEGYKPNDILPESDGLTAAQLGEFITAMAAGASRS